MLSNFIKITLRHGCFSVNLLHIFGITFLKNTCGGLLLRVAYQLLLRILCFGKTCPDFINLEYLHQGCSGCGVSCLYHLSETYFAESWIFQK